MKFEISKKMGQNIHEGFLQSQSRIATFVVYVWYTQQIKMVITNDLPVSAHLRIFLSI